MCLYPRIVNNRKYQKTKKNGGNIPPVLDKRTTLVPIGCGNCMECRRQKARGWQVRLHEEIKHNSNGIFVTLTFSDESIKELNELIPKSVKGYTKDNEIATIGVRRFLERWRKKHKKSVRHWLTTELGHKGTENIHLHGIIWTDTPDEIKRHWQYGYVWLSTDNKGYVNSKTINYIVKYISKTDSKHPKFKSKVLTSPGIGKSYLNRTNKEINKFYPGRTKEYYTLPNGQRTALPIYYRNYIYSEEEREKLWIEKLDKGIRYINGIKIDVSKGIEQFEKALKHQQYINRSLGYGELYEWDEIKYANELRNIKIEERISRAIARQGKKR